MNRDHLVQQAIDAAREDLWTRNVEDVARVAAESVLDTLTTQIEALPAVNDQRWILRAAALALLAGDAADG